MRFLLAFDKFKGSLTAQEASDAVSRGLRRGGFEGEIEICPIADGGEGFTGAVLMTVGGEWCEAPTHDAQGREVVSRYGMIQHAWHRRDDAPCLGSWCETYSDRHRRQRHERRRHRHGRCAWLAVL